MRRDESSFDGLLSSFDGRRKKIPRTKKEDSSDEERRFLGSTDEEETNQRKVTMRAYKDLLEDVLLNGEVESQRALVKGEEVTTKVLYGQDISFDLSNQRFPMVTTKRTSFKIVKEELKWFLRGENNVKSLQEKGVRIWGEWADRDGNLGGSYPGCWRDFGGTDQIRQLENLFRLQRKMGPSDDVIRKWKRRMILSSWNPNITDNRGPVGCHTFAQWHITMKGEIHCNMYMRSVDLFLGLPYNIACYALLTNLFAKIGGLTAGRLMITMGNAHIYSNHEESVRTLLERKIHAPPVLQVSFDEEHRDDWSILDGKWDAELLGYQCGDPIKGEIAV